MNELARLFMSQADLHSDQGLLVLAKDLRSTWLMAWEMSPMLLVAVVALGCFGALVPAATLWVSRALFDVAAAIAAHTLEPRQAFDQMLGHVLSLAAIGAVGIGCASALVVTKEMLGDALHHHARSRLFEKGTSLTLQQTEDSDTLDSLRNAYAEVGTRPIGVVSSSLSVLQSVIAIGGIAVVVSRLGIGPLALVILACIPGAVVASRINGRILDLVRQHATESRAMGYLAYLLTTETAAKELRLFGFAKWLLSRFDHYYQSIRSRRNRLLVIRALFTAAGSLFAYAVIAAATIPVIRRVASGQATVGQLSVFVIGIAQVHAQVAQFLSAFTGLLDHGAYLRHLFGFLSLENAEDRARLDWQGPIHTIEFQDVGFQYPGAKAFALRHVSFSVRRGEQLAVVGANGSGKSTLVRLLTFLAEPTEGRILVNGRVASEFKLSSLRSQVSAVFQDYGRFQLTLRENVGVGSTHVMHDDDEVERAIGRAGVKKLVEALPDRYDNMLGRLFPRGRQLSGGEWQTVALGRMHIRQRSVLVLDEPTASLDAAAEAEALRNLRAYSADEIVVMVSHRAAAVREADITLTMSAGSVSPMRATKSQAPNEPPSGIAGSDRVVTPVARELSA